MENERNLPAVEPHVLENETGSIDGALMMRGTSSTVSKCHIDGCDDGDY
jgi:hypothetical protein